MTPEEAPRASPDRAIIRKDLAELLQLSWPVVLSRLGIMGMGLSDAIVVGRYSAEELGYHALGWAPTSVVRNSTPRPVTTTVGLAVAPTPPTTTRFWAMALRAVAPWT